MASLRAAPPAALALPLRGVDGAAGARVEGSVAVAAPQSVSSPRDALWFRSIAEGCKRAEFWPIALSFVVPAFSCLQMVRAGAAH